MLACVGQGVAARSGRAGSALPRGDGLAPPASALPASLLVLGLPPPSVALAPCFRYKVGFPFHKLKADPLAGSTFPDRPTSPTLIPPRYGPVRTGPRLTATGGFILDTPQPLLYPPTGLQFRKEFT